MSRHEGLEALRRAFDAGFERAPEPPLERVRLLLVTAADQAVALPLDELGALLGHPPCTRVPSGRPGVVGLGVARGALVTLFDLATLLGRPARRLDAPAWAAITRARPGEEPAGLVFDTLVAEVALPERELVPRVEADSLGQSVAAVGGRRWLVVDPRRLVARPSRAPLDRPQGGPP